MMKILTIAFVLMSFVINAQIVKTDSYSYYWFDGGVPVENGSEISVINNQRIIIHKADPVVRLSFSLRDSNGQPINDATLTINLDNQVNGVIYEEMFNEIWFTGVENFSIVRVKATFEKNGIKYVGFQEIFYDPLGVW